ncbi:MAG: ArnT family glycosyltransferase [Phycisphaerales bacterium]
MNSSWIGHWSFVIRHSLTPWVILAAALCIGVAGMRVIPPDAHEVYVLRTAQEMHERGDWIVPVYQGELRLEKPPLSYWLTGLAAWMSGGSDHVQPWHGRVPSVLGGLMLVGCTMLTGRRMFDGASANLAGLVTATSLGFVTYAHSARPEMLYAGCCAMVMTGLVMGGAKNPGPRSGRPRNRRPSRACKEEGCGSFAGWVIAFAGFGLATLAKGPHVPGMIVGGFAVWALLNSEDRWRTVRRGVIWAMIGAAIVAATAGWWWWAVRHRIGAEQLAGSALGGEGYSFQWSRLLSVYYPVQMVKLTATWAFLIPAGVALLLHRRVRPRGASGAHLIGWWLLVALIAFWGASHRRDYYLLPYLGMMSLLLAAGAWRFIRIWHRQRWLRVGGTWYAAGLTVVLFVNGMGGYLWSDQRFASMDFARRVAEQTPADRLLAALGTHADLAGYAANRIIPYCEDVAQLQSLARQRNATELSVVAQDRFLKELADWSPREIARVTDEDSGKAMVLVRLSVPYK